VLANRHPTIDFWVIDGILIGFGLPIFTNFY